MNTKLLKAGTAFAAATVVATLGLGLGATSAVAAPAPATSTSSSNQIVVPLDAHVVSSDAATGTAVISGTGMPYSAILLAHEGWTAFPTIIHLDESGSFTGVIANLTAEVNGIEVMQFTPGQVGAMRPGGPSHIVPLTVAF